MTEAFDPARLRQALAPALGAASDRHLRRGLDRR